MKRERRFTGFDRRTAVREGIGYALVATAVWLGWGILKVPLTERGAPALAVTLDPGSPEVLRRAAEVELSAGRFENARSLSEESLARAPFNARALRVRGLAEAKLGGQDRADQMLTLAGNWSLRDDPTHAWLVEHRLKRGDYGSAFAHADTLARRRTDTYASIFDLFTKAAKNDARAFPVVVGLLAARPPWRTAYFEFLYRDPDAAPLIGSLAVALEGTDGPFTTKELEQLYTSWTSGGRFEGIRQVRQRINRPTLSATLQNGDFKSEVDEQFYPFGWRLGSGPGISATVLEDDLRVGNFAFRLDYDGFGSGFVLEQLLLLPAGDFTLVGEQRTEAAVADPRLSWTLNCAETGQRTLSYPAQSAAAWRSFRARFSVPAERCSAQWLRLETNPGDRRTTIGAWFDSVEIRPESPAR